MSLLDDLRKNRDKSAADLNNFFDKGGKAAKEVDDRFWTPTVGKDGNGAALIRFLPKTNLEVFPFVQCACHYFKNLENNKTYYEQCPTTISGKCPCCEANGKLYNSGIEAEKLLVVGIAGKNARKRQLKYISNILVINDPGKPENNGTVKLYKYGVKIFEKIKNMAKPPASFGEASIDVFDPWQGCNLKLRVKTNEYKNYDDSTFTEPCAIGPDEQIEAILNKMFDLQEFVKPSNFKSYDELKKRLDFVMDVVVEDVEDDDDLAESAGFSEPPVATAVVIEAAATPAPSLEKKANDPAEAELDSFFQNLSVK